jgi:hypothetical protein
MLSIGAAVYQDVAPAEMGTSIASFVLLPLALTGFATVAETKVVFKTPGRCT